MSQRVKGGLSVTVTKGVSPCSFLRGGVWKGVGILCFVAVLLNGCSREEGRPIPEAKVLALVVGKTTEKDVLKMFGPPEKKSKLLGEEVWVYRHIKSHGFLSVHTSSKTLRLRFDERGVLQDVSHNDKKRNEFF